MDEYIKRKDALDKAVEEAVGEDEYGKYAWIVYVEDLNAIPAADVVEVVRCPRCVNGQRVDNVWTKCAKDGTRRLENFYCAHGKERER